LGFKEIMLKCLGMNKEIFGVAITVGLWAKWGKAEAG
jgi:hypothetical protein